MPHRLTLGALLVAILGGGVPTVAWGDGAENTDASVGTGGPGDAQGLIDVTKIRDGTGDQETTLVNGRPTTTELAQAQARALESQLACDRTTARLEIATKAKDAAAADAAQTYIDQNCKPGATPKTYAPPAWVLATQAVATLNLPTALPVVSPRPAANEWNMVGVGYPLWLSVAGSATMSASASVQGYAVTLNATRTSVDFSMGDGSSLRCTSTTPYTTNVTPGTASPDCGYRYTQASDPGHYRVVATANWVITWSALGETGTIAITKVGGTSLTVGELEAVVTGS